MVYGLFYILHVQVVVTNFDTRVLVHQEILELIREHDSIENYIILHSWKGI